MNFWKKASAAFMAVTLCLSAASCGDTSWAMKVEDTQVPAGIYILNQFSAYNDATSHEDFDAEKADIWDNKLDDKDLADWINDTAADKTKEYIQIENMFAEAGLSLDNSDQQTLDYYKSMQWSSSEDIYNDIGVAESSYESWMLNQLKKQKVFDYYYSAEGPAPVDEATLKESFLANYAKVHMISFSLLDDTGAALDDEGKAAVKATADSYLQRAQQGEDMPSLIIDYQKQQAADSESEFDESTVDTTAQVIKKGEMSFTNYIPDAVNSGIFETAQIGQPILLEDESGYYLVLKYDLTDDQEAFEEVRSAILSDLKSDEFDQIVSDAADGLKVTYNDEAIDQFTAKKVYKAVTKMQEQSQQ
ncbi:MAG: hypothetical protein ACOX60_09190 [Massiliimalia sp.]|jgi:hypothetical protein